MLYNEIQLNNELKGKCVCVSDFFPARVPFLVLRESMEREHGESSHVEW